MSGFHLSDLKKKLLTYLLRYRPTQVGDREVPWIHFSACFWGWGSYPG